MATDVDAEEYKKAGSQAYSSGDYREAVTQFTHAITAETRTGTEAKQFLKLVYSNRSAAYLQLKNNDNALADANKCVEELDPQWPKGYIRKGDAYFAMRNWTQAYNAYNRAAQLAPNDTTAKTKADKAISMVARASDPQSNPAGFGSGAFNSVPRPLSGTLGKIQSLCGKAVGLCFLLYILPLNWIPVVGTLAPNNLLSYRIMIAASALGSLVLLYQSFGKPQLNMEYAAKVLQSAQVAPVMLALMLVASRPYLLGIMPLLINEVIVHANHFAAQLKRALPQIRAMPQAASYGPQIAFIEQQLNSPAGIRNITNEISKMGATCETMQGVFLIAELLLPSRNFMLVYMWWQYLLMRYLMDPTGHIKIAFSNLDNNFTQICSHQYCPAVVGRGYTLIKGFMIDQVKSKQQGAQGAAGREGGFHGCCKGGHEGLHYRVEGGRVPSLLSQ